MKYTTKNIMIFLCKHVQLFNYGEEVHCIISFWEYCKISKCHFMSFKYNRDIWEILHDCLLMSLAHIMGISIIWVWEYYMSLPGIYLITSYHSIILHDCLLMSLAHIMGISIIWVWEYYMSLPGIYLITSYHSIILHDCLLMSLAHTMGISIIWVWEYYMSLPGIYLITSYHFT
jgi:hypothetical protein